MEIEQVPATEWERWVKTNDAVILDVREPHEWELGTLPGAVLVSVGDLPEYAESLKRDECLLVVCRSGGRSQHAATFLKMAGFDHTANMAGGMKALGMQE